MDGIDKEKLEEVESECEAYVALCENIPEIFYLQWNL